MIKAARLFCQFSASILLLLITSVAVAQTSPVNFSDESSALDFVHASNDNGGNGLSGAAWFDYDSDGDLDAFIPNGLGHDNGLFRNDGNGSFSNVAELAGVSNGLGNAAVVAADFDNDGRTDLFLTGDQGRGKGWVQQAVKLYRNTGTGTFQDVTSASGIVGPAAHRTASAADIDNDGLLDLVIAGNTSTSIQPNRVYRNLGGLRFEDITSSAGLGRLQSSCASLFSDYDNDGDQDFFTVGCTTEIPLNLFRNDGQGRFSDVTAAAGFTTQALYMGLCGADYDHDGDTDIFATNYSSTRTDLRHALYQNNGDGTFDDVAPEAGVAAHEFAWGCSFTDLDNDGWDDLFFTGALDTVCQPGVAGCPDLDTIGPGRGNPGTLLFSDREGKFQEFSDALQIDLSNDFSSGVAHGDFDGNGFADLLIIREEVPAHNGRAMTSGRPVLLKNQGNENNWVAFDLQGTQSNYNAVGARVTVHAQDLSQSKEVYAGSSHLSTESSRLIFGLGTRPAVDGVLVRWPAGGSEVFRGLATNSVNKLVEGEGDPLLILIEGSWINAETVGEGILLDYLPGPGVYFAAWFTYKLEAETPSTLPPTDVGALGQRWMISPMTLNGQTLSGPLQARHGGAFDSPPNDFEATFTAGQLTINFDKCDHGTVEYEIDGVISGSFEIQPTDQFLGPSGFTCVSFFLK